jgi:hypothetical protein
MTIIRVVPTLLVIPAGIRLGDIILLLEAMPEYRFAQS